MARRYLHRTLKMWQHSILKGSSQISPDKETTKRPKQEIAVEKVTQLYQETRAQIKEFHSELINIIFTDIWS
jgi:exonuclease III